MREVERLVAANQAFVAARATRRDPRPTRHLAVLTCMDARIDVFAALGLHLGDAHVLRNAGGRVTDDVLRSLAVSTHLLGVDTMILMAHTGCGLSGITAEELRARTGADIDFYPIEDFGRALKEDVDAILAAPFLNPRLIVGFVYDVEKGSIQELIRWERPV